MRGSSVPPPPGKMHEITYGCVTLTPSVAKLYIARSAINSLIELPWGDNQVGGSHRTRRVNKVSHSQVRRGGGDCGGRWRWSLWDTESPNTSNSSMRTTIG